MEALESSHILIQAYALTTIRSIYVSLYEMDASMD